MTWLEGIDHSLLGFGVGCEAVVERVMALLSKVAGIHHRLRCPPSALPWGERHYGRHEDTWP